MSEVMESIKNPATPIALMDQVAKTDVPTESPLHHLNLRQRGVGASSEGSVVAQEVPLLGHLVIRGNADDSEFSSGVEIALGMPLPGALQSELNDALAMRWIAPDEWLLTCPFDQSFSVEMALRNSLKGHYSVVNASGGQTVLRLSGPNAVNVLKKSVPYDFHDSHFPVGKVITSVLAKTQAVIRRVAAEEWELVIRRSFADYAWRWLEDAGSEYGFVVKAAK